MDLDSESPDSHESPEAVSALIASVALNEFVTVAHTYLNGPRSIYSADLLEEAIKKHNIAKHKIDLLLSIDEKETSEFANGYEAERARIWGCIENLTARLRAQEQGGDLNKDGDDAIRNPSSSGDGKRPPPDPVIIRSAKRVIARYRGFCRREILEKDDDFHSMECSLEMIDHKYKRGRAVVRKAIDAATDPEDGQDENVDQAQAERLLKHLRTIWLDARAYFSQASDEMDEDSDLEEEYELGLLRR
ncbi:hypothetical protein F4859DRAFT_526245 [Xylaria cf. heliscus]|nr:hypothetical protein F4859DRAFT_526245 [Xylaria cf. heliscus]